MENKSLLMTIAIFTISMTLLAQETGTFTDSRDGKTYKTVKIGTQIWFAKNLAYKASSGCWAYDNNPSNVKIYGYLYNWETAKNVCPSGWHLPSDSAWITLTNFLGIDSLSGGKLKESGTIHWKSPNTGATNSSGFSGLPGGYRIGNDPFGKIGMGDCGYWWSYTEFSTTIVSMRFLFYLDAYLHKGTGSKEKELGMSVRCLRD